MYIVFFSFFFSLLISSGSFLIHVNNFNIKNTQLRYSLYFISHLIFPMIHSDLKLRQGKVKLRVNRVSFIMVC